MSQLPTLFPAREQTPFATRALVVALGMIYVSLLWFPGYNVDDKFGHLATLVLFLFGLRLIFKSPAALTPSGTAGTLLLLGVFASVGSFFNHSDILSELRNVLYTCVLFMMLPKVRRQDLIRDRVALIAGVAALAALLYAGTDWGWTFIKQDAVIRYGWTTLSGNPNTTALLIMAGLLPLTATLNAHRPSSLWLLVPASGLLLCLLIFQTRTLVLGLMAASVFYVAKRKTLPVSPLFMGGMLVLIVSVLYWTGALHLLVERGLNGRLVIWQDSLHHFLNQCSLLVGCGNQDPATFGDHHPHPHSIYIGTLVYAGLPALLCLLSFTVLFLLRLFKHPTMPVWGWAALMALAAGLVTSPRFLVSFNAQWVYTILPIILTWSELCDRSSRCKDGGVSDDHP